MDLTPQLQPQGSMMWRAGELIHLNSCYAPTVDEELIPEHPIAAFENDQTIVRHDVMEDQ